MLKTRRFNKTVLGTTLAVAILIMLLLIGLPFFKISLPETIVPLDGQWKISFIDSPDFSEVNFDDSNWGSISLPGKFINKAIESNGNVKGICWIRKTFSLNEPHKNAGILLGRIANADETFINGKKIGSTGVFPPNEFSMWNYTRSYILPENLLNNNSRNIIAVRISYNQIGEILGLLAVTTSDDAYEFGTITNFLQRSMGYMSIAAGVSIFFLLCVFYYKKPDLEEYFYYCLQLTFALPIVLEICLGWNIYPGQIFRYKLLGISWTAVNVAHPIFLHRIYDLKRTLVEKILWMYLIVILIACLFFTNEAMLRFNATILIIVTWFIGFYNISCHISALNKNRPYAKIFSFFGISVVIFSMHDGFVYLIKFSALQLAFMNTYLSIMIFHIGAVLLYTGTSLVLVARFIDIADEVTDLNASLENYILENSLLAEKLGNKKNKQKKTDLKISSKAEEKIKEVLKIIDEKYLDGLDRQILAESVGVHPDNLSKQFKTYTGKKLGDYIYELRIVEASKRLRETDENIIDIAFAVGFESLRTFNRVFPKIMGITPDRYRKQHMETQEL